MQQLKGIKIDTKNVSVCHNVRVSPANCNNEQYFYGDYNWIFSTLLYATSAQLSRWLVSRLSETEASFD